MTYLFLPFEKFCEILHLWFQSDLKLQKSDQSKTPIERISHYWIATGQHLMGFFLIEFMLIKHCSNAFLTSEFSLEQFYYVKLDIY